MGKSKKKKPLWEVWRKAINPIQGFGGAILFCGTFLYVTWFSWVVDASTVVIMLVALFIWLDAKFYDIKN